MRISDITEIKLLEVISELIEYDHREIMGFDDVSAVVFEDDRCLVLNVDSLSETSDILPSQPPDSIGWKLVTMTVSDFAAKGVKPMGALLSLTLRQDVELKWVKDFYRGLKSGLEYYQMGFWGGDLGRGAEINASLLAVGLANARQLVKRCGAKEGHLVFTTGLYGLTSLAYKHLLEGLELPRHLRETALKAVFYPKAKLREGLKLAAQGLMSASIDSSDGLAISLFELARRSGVRIVVEKVPVHPLVRDFCSKRGLNPEKLALYEGGEEFEVVFTVPPEKVQILKKCGIELYYIGYVEKGSGVVLASGEPLMAKGWDSVRGWL